MAGPADSALEATYHHLWRGPVLTGRELFTLEGHRIEIVESGSANPDAGPDFLAALLRIDGELVRGDVEIHTRARDWYLHRHHKDPRYNRVILHAVVHPSPAGFTARRQDGTAIPTLLLDAAVLPAEPVPAMAESAPPSRCPLADLPAGCLLALLDQAGMERLEMHAARFLEMREKAGWEEILHAGLFDALGYGKNQLPFRRLAALLPAAVLHAWTAGMDEEEAVIGAEALLFGAAGLLPPPALPDGEEPAPGEDPETPGGHLARLREYWRRGGGELHLDPMPAEAWQFFRLRPCNFPTRRVAAAARLLTRFRRRGLLHELIAVVRAARFDPGGAILALNELAVVEVEGYWASHHDLEARRPAPWARRRVRLVGRGRSREIAVNVFLPGLLAFARESEDGRLSAAVRALYIASPRLPENDLTRRMRKKLFGGSGGGAAPGLQGAGAVRQQGLIQLAQMRCRRNECEHCLALSPPEEKRQPRP